MALNSFLCTQPSSRFSSFERLRDGGLSLLKEKDGTAERTSYVGLSRIHKKTKRKEQDKKQLRKKKTGYPERTDEIETVFLRALPRFNICAFYVTKPADILRNTQPVHS